MTAYHAAVSDLWSVRSNDERKVKVSVWSRVHRPALQRQGQSSQLHSNRDRQRHRGRHTNGGTNRDTSRRNNRHSPAESISHTHTHRFLRKRTGYPVYLTQMQTVKKALTKRYRQTDRCLNEQYYCFFHRVFKETNCTLSFSPYTTRSDIGEGLLILMTAQWVEQCNTAWLHLETFDIVLHPSLIQFVDQVLLVRRPPRALKRIEHHPTQFLDVVLMPCCQDKSISKQRCCKRNSSIK